MRAFVSLTLPPGHVEDMMRLQRGLTFGRNVPEENLHLTLAFLGQISEAEARAVHDELAGVTLPSVTLELSGLDTFGGNPPHVLAAKARGTGLEALQRKITAAVRRAGIALSRRRFRPHVTFVRLDRPMSDSAARKLGEFLALNGAFNAAPKAAASVQFMESHLAQDGPEYHPLAEYDLTR